MMSLQNTNDALTSTDTYFKSSLPQSKLQITSSTPFNSLTETRASTVVSPKSDKFENKIVEHSPGEIEKKIKGVISKISTKTPSPTNNDKVQSTQPVNQITKPSTIYMDYQATTPIDPRVLDAMLPYYTSHFGNPHSRTHSYGWTTEKAITTARNQIATLINAQPSEIIFTSGATESNNLALKGLAAFHLNQGSKPHFITLQTEHKCVLDSLRNLQDLGCEVTYLKVNQDGHVDVDLLKNSIKDNTVCVSIMGVNNEIGVIQDLKSIGSVCKEKGVVFHCDAAQAFGKVLLDVRDFHIGLLSISGHKIYGPKGIGALFVNKRDPSLNRPRLKAIMSGGGQEFGLRSGTVPVALAVGLGKAADIAQKEMCRDFWHVQRLSKKLCGYLREHLTEISHNGSDSLCGETITTTTIINGDKPLKSSDCADSTIVPSNPGSDEKHILSTHQTHSKSVSTNGHIQINHTDSQNTSQPKTASGPPILSYKNITPDTTIARKWYPGCLNLTFSYVEGEGLMMKLNNIALSSGSACTSSSLEPSYTLRALNIDDENAHSSIRFGISKFTTEKDIKMVGEKVVESVKELREMSPLYEMVKDGVDLKSIQWAQE